MTDRTLGSMFSGCADPAGAIDDLRVELGLVTGVSDDADTVWNTKEQRRVESLLYGPWM